MNRSTRPSYVAFSLFALTRSSFAKGVSFVLAVLFLISPLAPVFAQELDTTPAPEQAASPAVSNTTTQEASPDISAPADTTLDTAPESWTNSLSAPSVADSEAPAIGDGTQMSALTVGEDVPASDDNMRSAVRLPKADEVDGSFTYEYPLVVSPGRNGVEPSLSLSYNSARHDRDNLFGSGWAINIPYIERINRTGTQSLYISNVYSSSLDGELVKESETVYKPRIENGNYRQYTFSNNVWTVTEKDGSIFKFGHSTSTQLYHPTQTSAKVIWMLEEKRDANDNYIKYTYYKSNNQIYPETIIYTKHGTTDGINKIEFLRETRGDDLLSYRWGFAATTTLRISEIKASANDEWVRKYTLNYGAGSNGVSSMLTTITESGRDEASSTVALPATNLSYTDSDTKSWSGSCTLPINQISGGDDNGVRFGDVNGDGLVDILQAWYASGPNTSENHIWINTGGCTWATSTLSVPIPSGYGPGFVFMSTSPNSDQGGRTADVNGDGLLDVLWYFPGENRIATAYINNGNGWTEQNQWAPPVPITDSDLDQKGNGCSLKMSTATASSTSCTPVASSDPSKVRCTSTRATGGQLPRLRGRCLLALTMRGAGLRCQWRWPH